MNPEVKLTGSLVILMPVVPPRRSRGGVELPVHEKYKGDTQEYIVLASGRGRWIRKKGKPDRFEENLLKRGDRVIAPLVLGWKVKMPNGTVVTDSDQVIARLEHD